MSDATRTEVILRVWKNDDRSADVTRMMSLTISSIQGAPILHLIAPANSPLWQQPQTHLSVFEALFHARRVELQITGRAGDNT